MNVALFGGTFDPIHRGHLAVAKAAQREYGIKQVLFVPSATPPHKHPLTPYIHRYAMVALQVAGQKGMMPSLLESPEQLGENAMAYSIETVRRVRAELKRNDRLFFIIGIDAFLDLAKWREPVALLREARIHHRQPAGIFAGGYRRCVAGVVASSGAGTAGLEKPGRQGRSSAAGRHDPPVAGCKRARFGHADKKRGGKRRKPS